MHYAIFYVKIDQESESGCKSHSLFLRDDGCITQVFGNHRGIIIQVLGAVEMLKAW